MATRSFASSCASSIARDCLTSGSLFGASMEPDVSAEPPRVVNTVSVGQTPDGAYLAVNSINGSHKPKDSPFFNDFGLLKIYRVSGADLTFITEAKVGH